MTHPLAYIIPVIVGVGAFIYLALSSNERENRMRTGQNRQRPYSAPLDDICTICLENYIYDRNSCERIKCGHIFHRSCYMTLLEKSGPLPKCPNCNLPVF